MEENADNELKKEICNAIEDGLNFSSVIDNSSITDLRLSVSEDIRSKDKHLETKDKTFSGLISENHPTSQSEDILADDETISCESRKELLWRSSQVDLRVSTIYLFYMTMPYINKALLNFR